MTLVVAENIKAAIPWLELPLFLLVK